MENELAIKITSSNNEYLIQNEEKVVTFSSKATTTTTTTTTTINDNNNNNNNNNNNDDDDSSHSCCCCSSSNNSSDCNDQIIIYNNNNNNNNNNNQILNSKEMIDVDMNSFTAESQYIQYINALSTHIPLLSSTSTSTSTSSLSSLSSLSSSTSSLLSLSLSSSSSSSSSISSTLSSTSSIASLISPSSTSTLTSSSIWTQKYIEALYEYATFLWKKTRYLESKNLCDRILQLFPTHSDAHNRLGTNLKALKCYEEAKIHYQYAIQYSQKRHKVAYNNLANVLSMDRATSSQAVRCYLKAIELDQNYVTAYTNYGIHLEEDNRHQDAIIQYQKALEIRSNDASIYSKLANAYSALNDIDKAEYYYREMLRCDPSYVSGISDYAVFLHRKHEQKKAKLMYEKSLSIDNHRPLTLRNYALLLQELGYIYEAFYHLDMATTVAMYNRYLNNNNHVTEMVTNFDSLKQYWLDGSITYKEDIAEEKIILNEDNNMEKQIENNGHGLEDIHGIVQIGEL